MKCAVMQDLNRHLANEEAREARWEAVAEQREQLEDVQGRLKELEAMTEWDGSLDDELAHLYQRQADLQADIDAVLNPWF